MRANYYMKKQYQDMQLRAYSEHTQDVYWRAVGKFLNYSGKSVEEFFPLFWGCHQLCKPANKCQAPK